MRLLWVFLWVVLVSLGVWAEPLVLEQADGVPLYYYYDPPPQKGPVVVILQGSECLRVGDKYGPLIQQLHKLNLGVLRVEKPGLSPSTPIGECPQAYLRKNTLERRVWDLLSVLGELRKRPDWDGRLALVGGSEGGMLAALCAPLIPETRAVALISSGGGLTFGQEIELTIASQMRSSGAPPQRITQEVEHLREVFEQARREPSTVQEWGSDGKLARNTHLWVSQAADMAVYRALLRVEVPILVVHGSADRSTPVQSAQVLEESFGRAGKSNLQLRVIEGAGHDQALETIQFTLGWVAQQLGATP